jgi:hypothetical protein
MKFQLFFLVGFFAYAAFGDPILPPTYLGQVKGVLFTGLHERDIINFEPGQPLNCTREEVGSSLVVYRCELKGTSVAIKNDKDSLKYDFGKLMIFYKGFHSELKREFHFSGTVSEVVGGVKVASPVSLLLWSDRSAPDVIKGSLNFREFGLSGVIQAVPVN